MITLDSQDVSVMEIMPSGAGGTSKDESEESNEYNTSIIASETQPMKDATSVIIHNRPKQGSGTKRQRKAYNTSVTNTQSTVKLVDDEDRDKKQETTSRKGKAAIPSNTEEVEDTSTRKLDRSKIDEECQKHLKALEEQWEAARLKVKQETFVILDDPIPVLVPFPVISNVPVASQESRSELVCKRRVLWKLSSPYKAPEPQRNNGKRKHKGYNPMVSVPKQMEKYMMEWINHPQVTPSNSWRLCVLSRKGNDWWKSLIHPGQWSDDETMDILFIFLRNKILSEKSPAQNIHLFTTADRVVTNLFRHPHTLYSEWKKSQSTTTYDWDKASTVMKYVQGELTDYSIPWLTVDAIYMPYNILDVLWILIKIDMVRGRLVVWDSYKRRCTWPELGYHLTVMRTVVPRYFIERV